MLTLNLLRWGTTWQFWPWQRRHWKYHAKFALHCKLILTLVDVNTLKRWCWKVYCLTWQVDKHTAQCSFLRWIWANWSSLSLPTWQSTRNIGFQSSKIMVKGKKKYWTRHRTKKCFPILHFPFFLNPLTDWILLWLGFPEFYSRCLHGRVHVHCPPLLQHLQQKTWKWSLVSAGKILTSVIPHLISW